MFKKSGKCIMGLATVLHVINIIVAVIAAIVTGVVFLEATDTIWGFVLGAIGALLLILMSWLSLMFVHAYGSIAANAVKQSEQLEKLTFVTGEILNKLNTTPKQTSSPATSYKSPVNSAPSYKPPVNSAPVYTPPVNSTPVYTPPTNPAPVYTPPTNPAPVYTPPASPAPVATASPVSTEPVAVETPAPASSHCTYCGAKLNPGAKFCTFCGHAQK